MVTEMSAVVEASLAGVPETAISSKNFATEAPLEQRCWQVLSILGHRRSTSDLTRCLSLDRLTNLETSSIESRALVGATVPSNDCYIVVVGSSDNSR